MAKYVNLDDSEVVYCGSDGDYEKYNIPYDMPTEDVPERNVGKWVSVTERLPKLGEKVLVSTKNTVFTQVFKCIHGTPDRWGWEHNSIKKVIAWMPLPEPYKEKKKNNADKID